MPGTLTESLAVRIPAPPSDAITIQTLTRRQVKKIATQVASLAEANRKLPNYYQTFSQDNEPRLTVAKWQNEQIIFRVSFRDEKKWYGRKFLDAHIDILAQEKMGAELQLTRTARRTQLVSRTRPVLTEEGFANALLTIKQNARRRTKR